MEMEVETSTLKLVGDSRHQSKLGGGRKAEIFCSYGGGVMKWNVGRVKKS